MLRHISRAHTTLLALLLVAACAPSPLSVIEEQPDGLRTFTVVRELNGGPMLCAAFAAVDPVSGVLAADPAGQTEKLWIAMDAERRSVVWPQGFSLRFEPDAVLYDDVGAALGREGEPITLPQVSMADHAGSFEDPYIAKGILSNHACYPFVQT
jgi:hypothetical protein